MDLTTLGFVVIAAAVHALWNVWLKQSGDRLKTLATMSFGWGAVAVVALPFIGFPARESWPYLAASTLIHVVYSLILVASYRFGALSFAYPVARGTGPLIVTIISVAFLDEQIGLSGALAIGLIVGGIGILGIYGHAANMRALLMSLLTGCLIGVYTLVDGLGGRAGDSPHAYSVWLFLLLAITIPPIALAVDKSGLRSLAGTDWRKDFIAGVISVCSYWIAIWAMSVAPLALVAAVRESSVAFAALFGGLLLKERVNWIGVLLVLTGVVLVRLVRIQ